MGMGFTLFQDGQLPYPTATEGALCYSGGSIAYNSTGSNTQPG